MALVVVTGRAGKNQPPGTSLATVFTNSKKDAYAAAEAHFRKTHKVDNTVALHSTTVFEGSDDDYTDFHNRLSEKMQSISDGNYEIET